MAQFVFNVPSYPLYPKGLDNVDRAYFNQYLTSFRNYASAVLSVQSRVAREAIAHGDMTGHVREMKAVVDDAVGRVSALSEASSLSMEREVVLMREEMKKGVAAVADVAEKTVAGSCGEEEVRAVVEDVLEAESANFVSVGKHSVRNRKKRQAKKTKVSSEVSDGEEKVVPEWRRKAGSGEHIGAFARCSQSVQDELRESRAKMLVKQNELAVVRAEAERRKAEALLKSQVVERDVENRRLHLDSEIRKARIEYEKNVGPGFAETIVSEGLQSSCSVPSMTGGSVSPNSSISVAELNKLNQSLSQATEDRFELRKAMMKKDERLEELEKKLNALTVPREAVRGSGRDGYSSWEPAYESPVDY